MEIPIQHDVYIWANYSVSKLFILYSNMLKCVNLIEIRFYASSFLVLWDHYADTGSWIRGQIRIYEGKYGYMRANTDIWGQIWIFEGKFALRANTQHWLLAIIGHAKTNILQQNMW